MLSPFLSDNSGYLLGHGQGHLHPCMELCNNLNKRNYHTTLVPSYALSSAIPSSFNQNPLTTVAQFASSTRPLPGSDPLKSQQAAEDLRAHLANSAAAMEWGAWKVQIGDVKPGRPVYFPGCRKKWLSLIGTSKENHLGRQVGWVQGQVEEAHQNRVTNLHGSQKLKGQWL
ncbi:unnamed protein product [Dovyalis caffra]|uniref:Uncharacterized protein n=1 Tax=Dovyalis caffra TaxID=77055 RepID=A0AAV1SPV6_9ROSI|nr:unnamed protein product [Dovyalis caffra]